MDLGSWKERLPVGEVAALVNEALDRHSGVVVTAPPGAGKSTLLPLTILESLPDGGKVLMLEPRRLAARQVAERMAQMLGEPVGRTVGYRIRFESRVSAQTRVEVLTEGILTRMLVDDPTLEGVSVVIFDEYHERSLASDVALALTREARNLIRPDLRLVIMSATIDAAGLGATLGVPVVESRGRCFPVETIHVLQDTDVRDIASDVARTVFRAYNEKEGDILAFLPGEAEIRRCQEILGASLGDAAVLPLYGMLPFEQQRRAIAPSGPGERKVVLATPIAETSLTIEGVRVVVDSGYCRKMVFDPQNALSHMETVRVSRDMADQRSGRAGRVAPGTCYRLWSLGTHARMAESRVPEIAEADLAPVVLDVAAWGEGNVASLPWVDAPAPARVRQAAELLMLMGALDADGRITAYGRKLSALPCHPRVAGMLVSAEDAERKALAADIAALLEEKDPLPQAGADLCARIDALRDERASGRIGRGWQRMVRIAEQYRRLVHVPQYDTRADAHAAGAIVAAAYPERVARVREEGCGRFLLACGDIAAVDKDDALAAWDWLAVASLNARKDGCGSIYLAAPLDPQDIRPLMRERDNVTWDARRGAVVARHEWNIGCLVVASRPLEGARDLKISAICEAARKDGLSMLDFSDEVQNLVRRVAAVASWHPELELPDLGTEAVLDSAHQWLPLYIGNATSVSELKKIDLCAAFWAMLDYGQQQAVERLAPSHIAVPTGSRIRVEYRSGADAPVLRVRLQECFGLLDTPRVDDGRLPVLMELLSPGFKPVQLTTDLRSFWQGTYFEVRKELRRRYPKHSWPDNPLEAEAVRGVLRKK